MFCFSFSASSLAFAGFAGTVLTNLYGFKLSEQLDLDFWFFVGLSAAALLLMFLGTLML